MILELGRILETIEKLYLCTILKLEEYNFWNQWIFLPYSFFMRYGLPPEKLSTLESKVLIFIPKNYPIPMVRVFNAIKQTLIQKKLCHNKHIEKHYATNEFLVVRHTLMPQILLK